MASANDLPCEEQLRCSICLDAFSEPVSTPCGHNYCKTCITGYWASSDVAQCPLCKKKFQNRPQLQVNTDFRDMVAHFNSIRVAGDDDVLAKPGEVPCDVCPGLKLKAQKTCLVCLASYCRPHLEPHRRVTTFKKHQLIDPVSNLEDRVCQKHDKMLELYCRADEMCVCFMCLNDDHVTHEAVPLEHAFRERKAQLVHTVAEIKTMENSKSRRIEEVNYLIEQSNMNTIEETAEIVEVFTALVVSLQTSQAELIQLVQEKQKSSERQAQEHVTQLEQEIDELRRRRSEMEQLLQTEDHLHLLQSFPSLYFPAHTGDLFSSLLHTIPPMPPHLSDINRQSYSGLVKKAVAQMEKTLSNEMEMLIHEVRLSDGCEAAAQPDKAKKLMKDEFITEIWSPPQDKLMMIQQCDAVDVTLDACTANSRLTVSEDGKQLSFHKGRLFFPALFGGRFIHQPFILGKDGFSSGRFYYEVQVSGCKSWLLGVVKESFNREISFPSPENGGWAFLKMYNQFQDEFFANIDESATMNLRQSPKTVGVFVDYEKGEVSFYDVDTRTVIFSYTGCTFTEATPPLKAFLLSMAGASFPSRPKLYPIFGMFGEDSGDVLVISPVDLTT